MSFENSLRMISISVDGVCEITFHEWSGVDSELWLDSFDLRNCGMMTGYMLSFKVNVPDRNSYYLCTWDVN